MDSLSYMLYQYNRSKKSEIYYFTCYVFDDQYINNNVMGGQIVIQLVVRPLQEPQQLIEHQVQPLRQM